MELRKEAINWTDNINRDYCHLLTIIMSTLTDELTKRKNKLIYVTNPQNKTLSLSSKYSNDFFVIFGSGMNSLCCKLYWEQRMDEDSQDDIVDLREDEVPLSVECTDDAEDSQVTCGDFVDLQLPIQCTEPP